MTISEIMKRDRCSYTQAKAKAESEPPVRSSDLLDAAEWCECLAAKLTLTSADIGKPQKERIKANTERIALWEAATIMRREASNAEVSDRRAHGNENKRERRFAPLTS